MSLERMILLLSERHVLSHQARDCDFGQVTGAVDSGVGVNLITSACSVRCMKGKGNECNYIYIYMVDSESG